MSYDLLLVNTHRQYDVESGFQSDWLGIYILASYIEQNGYSARAFSGFTHEVEPLFAREIPTGVKVVGFSCDYENQTEVAELCCLVRDRWHLPVIVGGPQAIALGEDFLRVTNAVAVVRGEGEIPLLALMQYLVDETGRLEDIPGILYLDDHKERRTAPPHPITNLDALPFIDSSLVLGKRFRANNISILTARGCPFRCAFCYEGGNTRSVRWRSVKNVMDELRQALEENPHIRFVLFTDDTFTLNPQRVRDFCQALTAYRRERDFCWFAEAHPQTILHHPELLPLMVEAGLVSLQIGVESGNIDTLKAYNKKTNPDLIERAVHICKEAHVTNLVANIIVGGAFETEKSIARSKEFGLHLLEVGVGMLELHAILFWPLPNTAMTTRPQDFGMEILDPQSKTSVTDYPVVRCGNLTPERISELRFDMDTCFKEKMRELAKELPLQTILNIISKWNKYYFRSVYTNILLEITRIRRFAVLLQNGATHLLRDIPEDEIRFWHPQRTCQPLVLSGKYFADDIQLEEEEYKVFVASSGRMNISETAQYCHMSQETLLHIAQQLENKMAVTFCRY